MLLKPAQQNGEWSANNLASEQADRGFGARPLAIACGFNAEGGLRSFRFVTRATESVLGEHVALRWGAVKPRTEYIFGAESFCNVATEIEWRERGDPDLLPAYGGQSLHKSSHGESFVDLAIHRFGSHGLYLLDEPETALSVQDASPSRAGWLT